jgi:hypothetical protein
MVSEESSIHRLLAAINDQPQWAQSRPWCMQCRSLKGLADRSFHCHHCGRHVCGHCATRTLPPEFFPKSFSVSEVSLVCGVCEDILVGRKEDNSSSTGVTIPASSLVTEDDEF